MIVFFVLCDSLCEWGRNIRRCCECLRQMYAQWIKFVWLIVLELFFFVLLILCNWNIKYSNYVNLQLTVLVHQLTAQRQRRVASKKCSNYDIKFKFISKIHVYWLHNVNDNIWIDFCCQNFMNAKFVILFINNMIFFLKRYI